MEHGYAGKTGDLSVVTENNACMDKYHPYESHHNGDDDGDDDRGVVHNAMNRNMDLIHNFYYIPLVKLLSRLY